MWPAAIFLSAIELAEAVAGACVASSGLKK
jgi:hypothetical protein